LKIYLSSVLRISKRAGLALRIALAIREPPDVKRSPSLKVKARVWLMDQIHGRQAVTKCSWFRCSNWTKQIPLRKGFSMASVILLIVLAISALGGGAAYAAQDSIPGECPLPGKARYRTSENDIAGRRCCQGGTSPELR